MVAFNIEIIRQGNKKLGWKDLNDFKTFERPEKYFPRIPDHKAELETVQVAELKIASR